MMIGIETKKKICDELIDPVYYRDIQTCIANRKFWKWSFHACLAISRFFAGVATILCFASAVFPDRLIFSFTAGSSNVISIVFHQYASYSIKEYKLTHHELNHILTEIQIHPIPDAENEDIKSEIPDRTIPLTLD